MNQAQGVPGSLCAQMIGITLLKHGSLVMGGGRKNHLIFKGQIIGALHVPPSDMTPLPHHTSSLMIFPTHV